MFLDFLLLLSVFLGASSGLGTKYNNFEFVELGQNGVDYQNGYGRSTYTGSISPPVNFGDETFNSALITQDGRIYFRYEGTSSPYDPFSFYSSNDYTIAPFWDNIDTYSSVSFEIHNQNEHSQSSQQLKSRVSFYIQNVLGVSVSVDSLLVVQWSGLRSYSSSQKTNKFQALIASSWFPQQSYAIFTYKCDELQWSTQRSTIGFKAVNGLYRNHPFSRRRDSPNPIACVNEPYGSPWSNVVYKIDASAEPCSSSYQFGCTDGSCLYESDKCDYNYGCSDGSDEIDCNFDTCTSNQYTCDNGGCVKSSYRCDGENDCSDGSDETSCQSISSSGYIGIVAASVVTVSMFCVIIIVIIAYNVKQRSRRRAQFQRLRSQVSVRPQTTPATYTAHFHPKPDEWYQTIEGQWVQGPPPAYTPEEGNPPTDEGNSPTGDEIELIGGFNDATDTQRLMATTDDRPATQQAQAMVEIEPVTEQTTEISSSADSNNEQTETETTSANEVGVANEEGNSLEASSSDNEDTPLIES